MLCKVYKGIRYLVGVNSKGRNNYNIYMVEYLRSRVYFYINLINYRYIPGKERRNRLLKMDKFVENINFTFIYKKYEL